MASGYRLALNRLLEFYIPIYIYISIYIYIYSYFCYVVINIVIVCYFCYVVRLSPALCHTAFSGVAAFLAGFIPFFRRPFYVAAHKFPVTPHPTV